MEATDWTSAEAYGVDEELDFHAAVAAAGVRHMYAALDRIAMPLGRAAARTRSPALRAEIEAAIAAMVSAIAVQDALGRVRRSDGPVALATTLHEVCRHLLTGPAPGASAELEVDEEVAFTLTEPPVAWAIATAVVEMAEMTGRGDPVRIRAEFLDGHLAIVVAGGQARSQRAPRRQKRPAGRAVLEHSTPLLDRLAAFLSARVVRGDCRDSQGVALVLKVRLRQAPSGPQS